MYSKAMILQLWYQFLDLDSSRCCWLLAAAGCRQQWLRPRSSPNGACGEWRTRAVRAPPGSRVPQAYAAPKKRFSCYTHKPRGGRQGRCHLSLALKIGDWLGTEKRGRVLSSATCVLGSLTLYPGGISIKIMDLSRRLAQEPLLGPF